MVYLREDHGKEPQGHSILDCRLTIVDLALDRSS